MSRQPRPRWLFKLRPTGDCWALARWQPYEYAVYELEPANLGGAFPTAREAAMWTLLRKDVGK